MISAGKIINSTTSVASEVYESAEFSLSGKSKIRKNSTQNMKRDKSSCSRNRYSEYSDTDVVSRKLHKIVELSSKR